MTAEDFALYAVGACAIVATLCGISWTGYLLYVLRRELRRSDEEK